MATISPTINEKHAGYNILVNYLKVQADFKTQIFKDIDLHKTLAGIDSSLLHNSTDFKELFGNSC